MNYTNSQMRALILDHVHSYRDRQILERRLIDGITFEKLAEEFELSERQVNKKKRLMTRKKEMEYRKKRQKK